LSGRFDSTLRIGIRDSCVGGLTVARCIRELLPDASLLYFADTAHVPYGDRSPEEVRHFALSITDFLIARGAQIVVFACNTSSAYALDTARAHYNIPILGMIEPGARAALAASTGGPIGVIATQATVKSEVYSQWLERLKPGTRCIEVGCPDFVPLVEAEQTSSDAALEACKRYLRPLQNAGVDTVVLGCTHYPLLLPALQSVAPDIRFVDPAKAVATELKSLCAASHSGSATGTAEHDVFYASGPDDGVRHWIRKLLPPFSTDEALDVRPGPIFDLAPVA
jgi:glutamate racemase